MRKQETVPFNPQAEAVLQYVPDFQSTVFTVTGLGEQLEPLAEHIQALEAAPVPKTHNVASKAGKAVLEASTQPTELTGRRATIAAKLYDLVNGSNMYDLLKQKRQDEADLAMARKLGLMSTVFCQKHERELAKLHRLTS